VDYRFAKQCFRDEQAFYAAQSCGHKAFHTERKPTAIYDLQSVVKKPRSGEMIITSAKPKRS